ncbi:phenylacetic acid degradation protein PaaY [Niveispirillum fermenti]|uniref:phenylacetic acid degradation protein PaaY n=1 Tax=Niveispirillum fermenti TaxID=1233113 RepID=UPI003A8A73DB
MPCYRFDGLVPVVDPTAFVHPTASLIGDVIIGPRCYIGPGAALRGDFGRLVVENGANVQDNCVMHSFPGADCVVEQDGHVGHGAVLHGCRVGRNALVGMNAVVMDGAVIGAESLVAAMSFVKAGMVVPARTLVAGSPARVMRDLTEKEIAWKSHGTAEYQELARRCHETLAEVEPLREMEKDRPRFAGGHVTLDKAR